MLEYLKGKLIEATPLKAVVDIGGLGYQLLIPVSSFSKVPPLGKEVLFYVSAVIREDSHKLFGFLTRGERDLFEKLLDVSGVGPKTALAFIGHLPLEELQSAIAHSNIALLCKIPGVGKKTAERLVIDMRDKVKNLQLEGIGSPLLAQGSVADAVSALIHLGYNPLQAQKAIKTALGTSKEEPPLAQLITAALRCI
jgi:Holliday junction DNA helicase RuvA